MSRPREYWKRAPDVSGLSDQELMALARELREEGFRGLVRRYEPAVKERIYDLVRDRDLTDDLLQTTWEKAFAALRKREPRNFSAGILRIAYNTHHRRAPEEAARHGVARGGLGPEIPWGPRVRGSGRRPSGVPGS